MAKISEVAEGTDKVMPLGILTSQVEGRGLRGAQNGPGTSAPLKFQRWNPLQYMSNVIVRMLKQGEIVKLKGERKLILIINKY